MKAKCDECGEEKSCYFYFIDGHVVLICDGCKGKNATRVLGIG